MLYHVSFVLPAQIGGAICNMEHGVLDMDACLLRNNSASGRNSSNAVRRATTLREHPFHAAVAVPWYCRARSGAVPSPTRCRVGTSG